MSIIRSTHQLEGLITLDNVKQIAVFSDFDSAVLFRAHHPAWEVCSAVNFWTLKMR